MSNHDDNINISISQPMVTDVESAQRSVEVISKLVHQLKTNINRKFSREIQVRT